MTASGKRLGRTARGMLVALALVLAAVLGLARSLHPDGRGYGTHEQLGLPPCSFYAMTGRPCPSCGMTTAFAWSVRLRPDRAWRANPAGSVLAPACAVLVPWLLACAILGRPWGTKSLETPLITLVVAIVALSLAAWTIRMLIGRA